MQIETRILIADVSALEETALFERFYAQMPAYRRKKIDTLYHKKDKLLSLGAGILLKVALDSTGRQADKLQETDKGKPFYSDFPAFHFNLSHSGRRVMCAVSDREFGCDTQQVGDYRDKVARRFFHPTEYQALLSQETSEARCALFYRLWALKESFLKATGCGLSLPPKSFSVTLCQDAVMLRQSFDTAQYGLYSLSVEPEYEYACCIKDDDGTSPPPITWIDFTAL